MALACRPLSNSMNLSIQIQRMVRLPTNERIHHGDTDGTERRKRKNFNADVADRTEMRNHSYPCNPWRFVSVISVSPWLAFPTLLSCGREFGFDVSHHVLHGQLVGKILDDR